MKKTSRKGPADLRKMAEEKLKSQTGRLSTLSGQSIDELVHELGTHQIELEMQNEELRRAQVDLEKTMRKYADLYDFAPVGYFTLGEKGVVHSVNITGATMIGIERSRVLKTLFSKFLVKEDRDAFFGHLREVFGSRMRQTIELRLISGGEAEIPVQLQSVFSEDEDDKAGRCRTAVIDISQRKQAEERIASLNAQLERKVAELSAFNREMGSFNYAVSHDLRAPLRSITGFTKIIMEDYAERLDEQGKDYFKRIIKAGGRMSGLIDDLLKLSLVGRADPVITTVNLSAVASEAARKFSSEEPERNVDFVIQDGLYASGNLNLLRPLLENLIGNAWKFTVKQEHARIEFGAVKNPLLPSTLPAGKHPSSPQPSRRGDQEGTIYYVRDNGIGFDMAYVDKLFLPFHRLLSGEEFAGTGIGLAIVHRIVTGHGGRVWAEGEPGKGATFYFTLPPADASAES